MPGDKLGDAEAWHLTDLVGASYVALAAIAGDAAAPYAVTLAELVAIAVLAQHPGGIGQTEWGRLQGVSRQRAHVVARTLEARGLVSVRRHGRDSTVSLSRSGRRLTERMRPDVGGKLASAMAQMRPARARELAVLLEELLASVTADRDGVQVG